MQTIIINFAGGDPVQHIKASQYDGGTKVRFLLMDGAEIKEVPEGFTAHLMGKKPDRTIFDIPCTADGCVVDAELTQQATIIAGRIPVELVIIKDSDDTIREGSKNLILDVEKAPVQQDDIESTDEYASLTAAVENAERAAENAAESAETAEAAAERIPTVTVTQTETGATITVTDSTGQETSAQLVNGQDGRDGQDGQTGPAGPAGSTGPAGPAGADGKSAYEIACEHGYIGNVKTAYTAQGIELLSAIYLEQVTIRVTDLSGIEAGDLVLTRSTADGTAVLGVVGNTTGRTGLIYDRTKMLSVMTGAADLTDAEAVNAMMPNLDAVVADAPPRTPSVWGSVEEVLYDVQDYLEGIKDTVTVMGTSGLAAGDVVVIHGESNSAFFAVGGIVAERGGSQVVSIDPARGIAVCTEIVASDPQSAYDTAVTAHKDSGASEENWLLSLHGADGQDGSDGADGQDGYTPVKGTDYWTAADQAAIVQDVLDALPDADNIGY